ncbi:MAG: ATP-grasp domain-containing protein [Lachnospiraceae bacterium]|nr:ATP-grasp domain-containing protein [Lachnospiraceae bacterium]
MTVGLTYDLREDYGIAKDSMIFADFCHPEEIGYMEAAIRRNGYGAAMIGNMYKLNERIRNNTLDCDIVLVCDEGISSRNREAIVPALLELNRIPYVGSDAYCMGLSQNKYHTKLVAGALGITCPDGIYLDYRNDNVMDEDGIMRMLSEKGLDFPLLVKPNEEGYSMGVFLVKDKEELLKAVKSDFDNYHEPVLVEEYIDGKEVYVPIVGTGDEAYTLPVGRVVAEDGSDVAIYCVEDKCYDWSHYEACELPEETAGRMKAESLKLYRHMGCRDFGRCDYRLKKDGTPVMIEITPRPGLTEEGPFESSAKAAGMTYDGLLKEIINSAAKRYGLTD